MGTFTRLQARDVDELAAAFALGDVRRWAPIAAGTINSNYELACATGRWFVRINEGKQEDDVAWEAALVGDLAAAGLPAPTPRAARDGRPYAAWQGRWISVFPWRDGVHLAPDDVTPAAARELGRTLGAIHAVAAALPAARRRPSRYHEAELDRRLAAIAAAAADDRSLDDAVAVLTDERARLAGQHAVRAAADRGIIHADLFRDNVLWRAAGDGPAAIVAVLDFEQASEGSLVYDVAVCINDWCWRPGVGPRADLASELLAGYEMARPLSAGDRAALPIEIRAAAARFTITRLTDVYLARVDNPDKDFRDFLARLNAWRGPELGRVLAAV